MFTLIPPHQPCNRKIEYEIEISDYGEKKEEELSV